MALNPSAEAAARAGGALPLIITLLHDASTQHPPAVALMQHACGALSAFADGDGAGRVFAAGGGEVILLALQAGSASPGCCEEALDALARLCAKPDARAKASAGGALEETLAVLRGHELAEGVQAAGMRALIALAAGAAVNRQAARAAGAEQAAHAALAALPDEPSVVDAAQALLRCLLDL